jgi:hypothetical protein
MEEKRENKALTVSYAKALGYNQQQVRCLVTLWTRESRFDHLADNKRSSAYGIAQLLRETDSRAEYQILRGAKYISARYETPCRAYKFFLKHSYY